MKNSTNTVNFTLWQELRQVTNIVIYQCSSVYMYTYSWENNEMQNFFHLGSQYMNVQLLSVIFVYETLNNHN